MIVRVYSSRNSHPYLGYHREEDQDLRQRANMVATLRMMYSVEHLFVGPYNHPHFQTQSLKAYK